jgi:hypothetical protein
MSLNLGLLLAIQAGFDTMRGIRFRLPMITKQSASAVLSAGMIASLLFGALPAAAQTPTQSFSDVRPTDAAFPAVEYLKSKGMVQGKADGTFGLNDKLTRAAAVKILVAGMATGEDVANAGATSSFNDMADVAWAIPYVELAYKKFKLVDGPPAKPSFNPSGIVKKAEFIKMALAAKQIDAKAAFGEINSPLASDVANPAEWYYPFMRYSISSSMTSVSAQGTLNPAKEITRGEMALLLYRLDMYRAGRRTQALLSQTEGDIVNLLKMLDAKDINQAKYASARAILASRGALASKPEEAVVKGAVKTAEGFGLLVRAYEAGTAGKFDEVIALVKEAYAAADKAKAFSPSLDNITTQMQAIAKKMADDARALQAGN